MPGLPSPSPVCAAQVCRRGQRAPLTTYCSTAAVGELSMRAGRHGPARARRLRPVFGDLLTPDDLPK